MTVDEAKQSLGRLVRYQPPAVKWGMYGKLTEVRTDGTGVLVMGANLSFQYPLDRMEVVGGTA